MEKTLNVLEDTIDYNYKLSPSNFETTALYRFQSRGSGTQFLPSRFKNSNTKFYQVPLYIAPGAETNFGKKCEEVLTNAINFAMKKNETVCPSILFDLGERNRFILNVPIVSSERERGFDSKFGTYQQEFQKKLNDIFDYIKRKLLVTAAYENNIKFYNYLGNMDIFSDMDISKFKVPENYEKIDTVYLTNRCALTEHMLNAYNKNPNALDHIIALDNKIMAVNLNDIHSEEDLLRSIEADLHAIQYDNIVINNFKALGNNSFPPYKFNEQNEFNETLTHAEKHLKFLIERFKEYSEKPDADKFIINSKKEEIIELYGKIEALKKYDPSTIKIIGEASNPTPEISSIQPGK